MFYKTAKKVRVYPAFSLDLHAQCLGFSKTLAVSLCEEELNLIYHQASRQCSPSVIICARIIGLLCMAGTAGTDFPALPVPTSR